MLYNIGKKREGFTYEEENSINFVGICDNNKITSNLLANLIMQKALT